MPQDEILERMLGLIKANSTGVLATADSSGLPHASLMGYATGDSGVSIFMITPEDTRKYRNILQNPRASLLIRDGDSALTAECAVSVLNDPQEVARIKALIAGLRPGLAELSETPGIAAIRLDVESLQLLDGPVSAESRTIRQGEPAP